MKEIEDFKKQNGNFIKFTTKELIGALHIKIDKTNAKIAKIDTRLSNGDKRFAVIQTKMNFYKRLLLGLYGLMGAIITGVLIKYIGGLI